MSSSTHASAPLPHLTLVTKKEEVGDDDDDDDDDDEDDDDEDDDDEEDDEDEKGTRRKNRSYVIVSAISEAAEDNFKLEEVSVGVVSCFLLSSTFFSSCKY